MPEDMRAFEAQFVPVVPGHSAVDDLPPRFLDEIEFEFECEFTIAPSTSDTRWSTKAMMLGAVLSVIGFVYLVFAPIVY